MKLKAWLILAAITASSAPITACSSEFRSCITTRTCPPAAGGDPGDAGEGGAPSGDSGASHGHFGGSGGREANGNAGHGGGAVGIGGKEAGGGGAPCGNGRIDLGEQCDLGAANKPNAYGPDLCTSQCKAAPYCGDGVRQAAEVCDRGTSASTDLGACNPECTGFYEKKWIKATPDNTRYSTNLGGIAGADAKCHTWFGDGYKALLVGATRRATVTPFRGDFQLDWVIAKYRHYYNLQNELIWRTDAVALLGVRDGKRQNAYANVYPASGSYPWSGYAADWTTYDDRVSATTYQGTCDSWTSDTSGWGSFVAPDLSPSASELCGASSFILCVEQ